MSAGTANKRRGRGVIILIGWGLACHHIYKYVSPELFVHKRKEKVYKKNLEVHHDKKEIRLLRLQPGYPWSGIHCELSVASLEPSQVPKYLALSYTWNEPIQSSAPLTTLRGIRQHVRGLYQHYFLPPHETILINGSSFPITRSLSTALRHLRDFKQPRDFWIDAICINQDDDEEKGQQVQMMPDIYSKAHLTYIWLGPRADGSNQAMDFVKSANKIDVNNVNRLDTENLIPTRALIALFNRTWWQRVWVIQEAFLSRRCIVMCGTKEVPFWKFESLVNKERKLRETARSAIRTGDLSSPFIRTWSFIPPTLPFYGLFQFKSLLGSIRKKNPEALPHGDAAKILGALVQATVGFQSTLPRDKVYGLLGLVPEAGAYIRPIYGPKTKDGPAFKDLSVYYIKWSNSLNAVVEWRKAEDKRVDVPSWVIDCDPVSKNDRWQTPIPFGSKYEADGGFQTWLRLTPIDVLKRYDPDISLDNATIADSSFWRRVVNVVTERLKALRRAEYGVRPEFSADTSTLRLHGLVFDTVTATSHPPLKLHLQIDRVSQPTPNGWWSGMRQVIVQYHRLRQFILRWKAFLEVNTKTAPDPYLDIENKGGRQVAFWRTVMANQMREPGGAFERPDDKFMDKIPHLFSGDTRPYTREYWFPPVEGDIQEISTDFRIFGAELMRVASSRSLIITEKGFIGVAPMDTRPGDVVCVVRGYHMPIVIRPVEAKQGVYRLIGNSYVHGIMDGSFARAASRREVKKLEIE